MNNLLPREVLSTRANSCGLTDLTRARDLKKREKTLETQPCETDPKSSFEEVRSRLNHFVSPSEGQKEYTKTQDTKQLSIMFTSLQPEGFKVSLCLV